MCGGAAPDDITAILPGSKWRCLLPRIVFQDALSEVAKIYPPPQNWEVFVDDITALSMGKNKEAAEMAKKVMEKRPQTVDHRKWIGW